MILAQLADQIDFVMMDLFRIRNWNVTDVQFHQNVIEYPDSERAYFFMLYLIDGGDVDRISSYYHDKKNKLPHDLFYNLFQYEYFISIYESERAYDFLRPYASSDDPWYQYSLASFYFLEDVGKSKRILEELLSKFPDFELARLFWITTLQESGEFNKALQGFKSLDEHELRPIDTALKINICYQLELFEECIRINNNSLNKQPNIYAYQAIAESFRELNRPQEGIEYLNQCVAFFPLDFEVRLCSIWYQFNSGSLESTLQSVFSLIKLTNEKAVLNDAFLLSILLDSQELFSSVETEYQSTFGEDAYMVAYQVIFDSGIFNNFNLPVYQKYRNEFGEEAYSWLCASLENIDNLKGSPA